VTDERAARLLFLSVPEVENRRHPNYTVSLAARQDARDLIEARAGADGYCAMAAAP
jgi:hypothetical protein